MGLKALIGLAMLGGIPMSATLGLTYAVLTVEPVTMVPGTSEPVEEGEKIDEEPTATLVRPPTPPAEGEAEEVGPEVALAKSAVSTYRPPTSSRKLHRPKNAKKRKRTQAVKQVASKYPEIQKTGAFSYTVERDFVDDYTSSFAKINSLGWVEQHKNSRGKADGFTVHGVSSSNPLYYGGIRSGDVIHAVNDRPVKNMFQALAAYGDLRKADLIELDITRSSEPLELEYQIR
ncbi:MAG: PDZ domain-containing protein [Proteobacteria bacterium]|jgi:hypothetical protein|nr:PDZ domain-containing protein [Pseudomonadota bacterium]